MDEKSKEFKTVDEYIALFTPEIQDKLNELRKLIKETVPQAEEKISWRMPTYGLFGNLVHFAAFKNHIGFYPGESGIAHYQDKLKEYKSSKGAVQFQLNQSLPVELIREVVLYRMEENLRWQKEKENKAQEKKQRKVASNQEK